MNRKTISKKFIFKRLLSLLLVAVLTIPLFPMDVLAADVQVSTFSDLQSQIAAYANATADMTITITDDILVTAALTIPDNANGCTLTINAATKGDGTTRYSLMRGAVGIVISVGTYNGSHSARLVLENIVIDGNSDSLSSSGSLIFIRSRSILTMNSGAVLQNNTSKGSSAAGGVNVIGTFNMTGGEIKNNSSDPDYYTAAGVHVNGGVFTMTGGTISGNTTYQGGGGGVYVVIGTFNLGGTAKIAGNTNGETAAPSNVYLVTDRYIMLGTKTNDDAGNGVAAPALGMEVHVTKTANNGVIVNAGANSTIQDYFYADDITKEIAREGDTLKIVTKTIPAYTITASAASGTPMAGGENTITLTARDSDGNTDTAFTGDETVTLTGILPALSGTEHFTFGQTAINDENRASVTTNVSFSGGVSTNDLKLSRAAEQNLTFGVTGINTAESNQVTITPTYDTTESTAVLTITTQPEAPTANGGMLGKQPVLTVKDKYGNPFGSGVAVVASARNTWTIGGTVSVNTDSTGMVTYTDLTAGHTEAVTDAVIRFILAGGSKSIDSNGFNIPAPALIDVSNVPVDGIITHVYNGSTFDVNRLFILDDNAGAPTYSYETGGTGGGSLNGRELTITKAGTFTIGLETAATSSHSAGAKITKTFTVIKGSQSTPSAPVSTGITDTSVTLAADSDMEFSKDGSTWQTSNVFSGLSSNTAYSFYQRLAATDLYNASGASAALAVTTASAACTVAVINGTGGGGYAQGAVVTVTANTPSPGLRFKGWTATGLTGADLTQNPLTFTMPANNVELTATYEEAYISEVETGTDAHGITAEGLSDLFMDANQATEDGKGFTQQDKDYVENGGTVKIVLSVEKKEEDAAAGASDILGEASANNQTPGLLLNIEVLKYRISSNGSIEDIIVLTELNTLLTIVIPLPEEMQGKNHYSVYRYHGASVDIITATPNTDGEYMELTDDGTIVTLHAKKFSTYGIAHEENNGGTGGNVNGGDVSGGDVSGGDVSCGDDGSQDKGGNGTENSTNSGNTAVNEEKPRKEKEPDTGDNSLPIATIAMIGGLAYLMDLLLSKNGKRRLGMTEASKNRIVETIIQDAKKYGKIVRLLALGIIFVILVFYYSVGRIVEFEPNELA